MLSIVTLNNSRQTAMTQEKAFAIVNDMKDDTDMNAQARYNVGAWYVDIHDNETGERIGTL